LIELAKSHENKTGTWLGTIKTDVMATLKGQLSAGAGIDPAAPSVAAAAQQMETFFKESLRAGAPRRDFSKVDMRLEQRLETRKFLAEPHRRKLLQELRDRRQGSAGRWAVGRY
jgi:hypothetical protein